MTSEEVVHSSRLPVWQTTKLSYASLWRHSNALRTVVAVSTLPAFAFAVFSAGVLWPWSKLAFQTPPEAQTGWPYFATAIAPWLDFSAQWLIWSVGAIVWHRTLLAEAVSQPSPDRYFRKAVSYTLGPT